MLLAEPRHHAGGDERALADAARAEHREHRRAHQAIRQCLDLALAADERLRIALAIRRQARIGRPIIGLVLGVAVLGRQRGEPLAGRVVVALEAPRRRHESGRAAPAPPQEEQLGLARRQRGDHLRER